MRSTVSTACEQFQATLRHVWASGSAMVEITTCLGITKDQLIRLRGVLKLPLRLDRSQRAKSPRYRDPTPTEIRAACAALRAKHLEQRRNEPADRVYRVSGIDRVEYRLDQHRADRGDDPLENLMDSME